MRKIESFEVVDHGIQHEQYFQGCGIAFTSMDDVATGIGECPAEAIDDVTLDPDGKVVVRFLPMTSQDARL